MDPNTLSEVRQIKKCLPEIMDDFHSMFEKVELRVKLIENKRQDTQLKKEQFKQEALEIFKRYEIILGEVHEMICGL